MASNYPPPSQPYGSPSAYGSFVPQQQGYYQQGYPPPQYPPQQGYPPQPQSFPQTYQGNYGTPEEIYSQPPPPAKDIDYESGSSTVDHSSKFVENTGWRDLPFFFIFLLHLLLVGAIFVGGLITRATGRGAYEDADNKPLPEPEEHNDAFQYFLMIGLICSAVSIVLAYLWLLAVQKFAKYLIKASIVFSVLLLFGFAAVSFAFGAILSGIFLAFFGGLMIFLYITWRSRIAFATRMLKLCGHLVERFPGTARVAYLAILLQFGWIVFWTIAISLSQQYVPALSIAMALYLLFSLFWTSQVIKNVVHVTAAGTFATWYFMEGTVGVPPNPTIKSFKRATTTSIGSICLGSMIVALIKTLRAICASLRHDSDNLVVVVLAFIATCILDMIDSLMQYFNTYAFAQIAIYGKTYCQAARDTWALVHSHGVEAIINDNLIGNVTSMACFVSGAAMGTLGAVLAYILRDQLGGDYALGIFFLMFFVGFLVVMVTLEVVESAVVTVFVCFAEDPHALKRNSPKLYKKLKEAYEERCTLFD